MVPADSLWVQSQGLASACQLSTHKGKQHSRQGNTSLPEQNKERHDDEVHTARNIKPETREAKAYVRLAHYLRPKTTAPANPAQHGQRVDPRHKHLGEWSIRGMRFRG